MIINPYAIKKQEYLGENYPIANQDVSLTMYFGNAEGYAQGVITPAGGWTISSLEFYMFAVGSPPGSIQFGVYSDSSGPVTPVIAQVSMNASELTGTYARYKRELLSPVVLTGSTVYYFGVRYAAGDGSNAVVVGANTAGGYSGGTMYRLVSGAWGARTEDIIFYSYRVD